MNKTLIEVLAESTLYQEYESAYSEMTGLPVALRPVESWQLPFHGKRFENPFCALVTQKSGACTASLQAQQQLSETATRGPQSVTSPTGICDFAVPVRLGERLIGFLTTGQVFCKKPTEAQFSHVRKLVAGWGVESDEATLRRTYFGTRVLTERQHQSALKLLSIFAEHLSLLGNQLVVQSQHSEPPLITKAKQYIADHQGEELSLEQVAKSVHTSKFYFCKIFKKGTGINFTDYLSRLRIERAKSLLLNPHLRVTEIAYEAGFQSLTHFNRVFKRILGLSPTRYREQSILT
jgi:AraC-like DNA-binding protein/ligand-binding sensor protein